MNKNRQLEHEQVAKRPRTFPVCILAHDMEGPANVGSLFRLADAFGVETLYLSGTSPTPPNPKLAKMARATERSVRYEYHPRALDVIEARRKAGDAIVSLEITTHSVDIRQLERLALQRICLVIGSENRGVAPELLDASDHTLHIPMFGQNSSLNVATAAAIALFELTRGFLA